MYEQSISYYNLFLSLSIETFNLLEWKNLIHERHYKTYILVKKI